MREVCGSFETEPKEFNGERDHVHLLVHYPPKYTGRINRIGLGSVFWSRSYFAGSYGGAPLNIVRQYIEGQKRPT
ncbi:transposase, partial [Streptomyces sp. NPDC101149]|uniref:transposase n=1 Tax=Streptomyces sp. NPDC101149 TaxID=3366113 RepID=UPI0037F42023